MDKTLDTMAVQLRANELVDELLDLHAQQEENISKLLQTLQEWVDLNAPRSN